MVVEDLFDRKNKMETVKKQLWDKLQDDIAELNP